MPTEFIIAVSILMLLIIPEFRSILVRFARKIQLKCSADHKYVRNEAVILGGVRQFIQIKAYDSTKNILLFVHGGPGWSETAISYEYQNMLKDHYVIVNWDQRCVGETALLSGASPEADIHMEDIVSDAAELAAFLKNKFSDKKLFVIGHSWGSVVGGLLSSRHPDLVDGYIGWGQVSDMDGGEKLAFAHTMDLAKEQKDSKTLESLAAIQPYPCSADKGEENRRKMTIFTDLKYDYGYGSLKFVGTKHFCRENLRQAIKNPYYHLRALKYIGNERAYAYILGEELKKVNMTVLAPIFRIPVIMIYGDNDWQTPFVAGEEYLESIEAPYKKIYYVKNAGHSTTFDNARQFTDFLKGPIYDALNTNGVER